MPDEVCQQYTAVHPAGKRKGGQDILLDLRNLGPESNLCCMFMILE